MFNRPDRSFGKWILRGAVQLHAARLIESVRCRKFKRARRTLKNRTRVQQIGIRNPNAATLATHDAHSKISVPRDRRKEERGIKLHRTNA